MLKRYIALVGIILLLAGCESNNESDTSAHSQPSPEQGVTNNSVSKAIEGSAPAIPDKAKDMALVAEETERYRIENSDAKDLRDKDQARIKEERIRGQTPPDQ